MLATMRPAAVLLLTFAAVCVRGEKAGDICRELCISQGSCDAQSSMTCESCKKQCEKKFAAEDGDLVLDEETKLMVHRLLLVAATTEDETIWQTPEMTRLLLVLLQKLEENKEEVTTDPGKDIPDSKEDSDITINDENICEVLCMAQGKCDSEYSKNCDTCKTKCSEKISAEDRDFDLDDETNLMIQRLLLVAAITEDETIWETPEMRRLLTVLIVKLEKAMSKNPGGIDEEDTAIQKPNSRSCKEECRSQCISTQQRKNIMSAGSKYCRRCIRVSCRPFLIRNTDCSFVSMETKCSTVCPPVSDDIKRINAECSTCKAACSSRGRKKGKV